MKTKLFHRLVFLIKSTGQYLRYTHLQINTVMSVVFCLTFFMLAMHSINIRSFAIKLFSSLNHCYEC